MISRFHYITQDIPGFTHAQLAELACKGGAEWIQLRIKTPLPSAERRSPSFLADRPLSKGEGRYSALLKVAEEAKNVCKKYNAKLIVNDYVIAAKEVLADGVHLGKDDMALSEARKILGNNCMIGGSANTMEDIRRLAENGADYIGIGPYRFTKTKEKLNPVLGLESIRKICEQCEAEKINIPLIAIGGIQSEDVELLMHSGVFGIAVSSAVNFSEDKIETTKKFLEKIKIHTLTQIA